MKRPSFQFYPGDWLRDGALRLCSVSARGLWIEMMCVMHQAEPYGHLVLNGNAITPAQLARMVGASDREVKRWLAELGDSGVFSTDERGRIFSRRMVRDEQVRNARANGGHAGAEHGIKGAEHGHKGGRPRKATGDVEPPLKPAPSSSSSSSSSSSPSTPESKDIVGPQPDALTLNGDEEQPSTAHQLRQQAREVLAFLNEKAGRNYQPVPANVDLIIARLKEGASVGDCRAVIAKKCREWLHDDKMHEYLRPATLFNRLKFAQYVGELVAVDASVTAAAPEDSGEVVERIPLNDGGEFEVRRSYVSELDQLFPQVDPVATLGEIRRWIAAAGAEARPSRSNARRFIASWFTREQEKWSSGRARAVA